MKDSDSPLFEFKWSRNELITHDEIMLKTWQSTRDHIHINNIIHYNSMYGIPSKIYQKKQLLLAFKTVEKSNAFTRVASAVKSLWSKESKRREAIGIKTPLEKESWFSIWTHLNLRGKYRRPGNKWAIPFMIRIHKESNGWRSWSLRLQSINFTQRLMQLIYCQLCIFLRSSCTCDN